MKNPSAAHTFAALVLALAAGYGPQARCEMVSVTFEAWSAYGVTYLPTPTVNGDYISASDARSIRVVFDTTPVSVVTALAPASPTKPLVRTTYSPAGFSIGSDFVQRLPMPAGYARLEDLPPPSVSLEMTRYYPAWQSEGRQQLSIFASWKIDDWAHSISFLADIPMRAQYGAGQYDDVLGFLTLASFFSEGITGSEDSGYIADGAWEAGKGWRFNGVRMAEAERGMYSEVPAPGTLVLAMTGVVGFGVRRRESSPRDVA